MSYSWEAQERKAAQKGKSLNDGEAGDFAGAIGDGVGDLHIDDIDFGESEEDRRFDQLVEIMVKRVSPETARQLARDIVAIDSVNDRKVASEIQANAATVEANGSIGIDAIFRVIQRADELAEFLAMYWADGRKDRKSVV